MKIKYDMLLGRDIHTCGKRVLERSAVLLVTYYELEDSNIKERPKQNPLIDRSRDECHDPVSNDADIQ